MPYAMALGPPHKRVREYIVRLSLGSPRVLF